MDWGDPTTGIFKKHLLDSEWAKYLHTLLPGPNQKHKQLDKLRRFLIQLLRFGSQLVDI